MQESNNNTQAAPASSLGLSIAIIVAAVIIGGAVVYTNKNNPTTPTDIAKINLSNESDAPVRNIPPVTADDHVWGDSNAPIKIVEYSDMECPYCVRLHTTLLQLTSEHSDVAWVYRHMPLHRQSAREAIATECAADLGGNDMFWKYINKIYGTNPGNDSFNLSLLPTFAKDLGLDAASFETCMKDTGYLQELKKTTEDGYAAMRYFGRLDPKTWGTPFSVIITPQGEYYPVFGAQPIEVWRQIIDQVKAQQ